MTKRLLAPACALACLLVAAPPATAAAPASARAFAAAALRFEQSLATQRPEVARRFEDLDLARCFRALEDVPRRASARAYEYVGLAFIQPLIDVFRGFAVAFVVELETIPTRDPGLRAGRAAWRETLAAVGRLPRVEQPCDELVRWARTGFRPSAAPPLSTASLFRELATAEAKIERAASRLRRLGIPARAARRFTAEGAFDNLLDLDALEGAFVAAER